jgi:hypothetical protein
LLAWFSTKLLHTSWDSIPNPTPLEKLLIERIIETRVALTVAEYQVSQFVISLSLASYG